MHSVQRAAATPQLVAVLLRYLVLQIYSGLELLGNLQTGSNSVQCSAWFHYFFAPPDDINGEIIWETDVCKTWKGFDEIFRTSEWELDVGININMNFSLPLLNLADDSLTHLLTKLLSIWTSIIVLASIIQNNNNAIIYSLRKRDNSY